MSTSITLEIRTDEPGLRKQIEEMNALGQHSEAYLEMLAAIHTWEAQRLYRQLGARRQYEAIYSKRRKKP